MNKEELKVLLEKALRQEADPEEYSVLMELIEADQGNELSVFISDIIKAQLDTKSASAEEPYEYDKWHERCLEILNKDFYSIQLPFTEVVEKPVPVLSVRKFYWVAAASLILLLAAAAWLWLKPVKKQETTLAAKTVEQDVQPGTDKAILRLADGSSIELDSMGNGSITAENGITVNKKGGLLEYLSQDAPAAGNADRSKLFNILSTPRGGQYQLVLPDGTRVWLNAASSIKYPVAFPRSERRVEVTGEAYFEVKKDAIRPFIVTGADQEVRVLGTSFNINVYEDEPLQKVTLIEGAVQVSAADHSTSSAGKPAPTAILKPGQQAKVNRNTLSMDVVEVDTDEATSWKNGFFYTRKANLGELMRQIGRWFDVQVKFENQSSGKASQVPTFSGAIGRNLTLAEIIKILELSDVKVKLEGKQITILP